MSETEAWERKFIFRYPFICGRRFSYPFDRDTKNGNFWNRINVDEVSVMQIFLFLSCVSSYPGTSFSTRDFWRGARGRGKSKNVKWRLAFFVKSSLGALWSLWSLPVVLRSRVKNLRSAWVRDRWAVSFMSWFFCSPMYRAAKCGRGFSSSFHRWLA